MKTDNSGYILVDFSKINHALKTQTIDGFYKYCERLVSNEKFVLLTNVKEVTTPVPSVVIFKNAVYTVITQQYYYTITSNDLVTVDKNEGGITPDIIDDDVISLIKTWSSSKINDMIPDNAGQIVYDNTVSHLQANRVQTAIDETVDKVNNLKAADISYSNTTSGLTAANVQGAIDENAASITTINNTLPGKQNSLTAGSNITIESDIISATDTTYTAGNNVSISAENVISAVDTTYTAGNNISISNENVISAIDTTYGAGSGINITNNNIALDIDNLTASSALSGTEKIAIYDGTGNKSTTAADLAGLANTYSTTEMVVGKWIDNKPIYRKYISGSITDGDTLVSGVDTFINAFGVVYIASLGRLIPYYEYFQGASYGATVRKVGTNITASILANNQASSAGQSNLFIDYTKA